MAVRQYIGARYVIKVYENSLDPSSAEWEQDVTYEPLTMVTFNNSSYLSKKEVPGSVGNPAANPSYWVVTGAYNGQIAALQSQIDAINAELANYGKRKFLFLGDSYYVGETDHPLSDLSGIGWAHQVIDYLNLTPDDYILAPFSAIANIGGGASTPGFYPSAGSHKSFKTILELTTAGLTDDEKASVTDIVVAGGFNDRTQGSAIYTGISDYVTFAKNNFPNAKLWCATIGYSTSETYRSQLIDVRTRYRNSIIYGMTYIDLAEYVLAADSLFSADGIHPTEAGYQTIGKSIASALIGGGQVYGDNKFTSFVFDNTIVSSVINAFGVFTSNYGTKQVVGNRPVLVMASPVDITAGTAITIPFTCDTAQPSATGFNYSAECDTIHSGGEDLNLFSFTIKASGTSKYLVVFPYKTLTGVTHIGLPAFTQNLDCNTL